MKPPALELDPRLLADDRRRRDAFIFVAAVVLASLVIAALALRALS
jgi:hypothetical protein